MQFHVSTSPSSVWNFMSNCAHIHPDQWWMEPCYPITCLLTVRNTSVADCLDPEMAKQLHNEIFQYRSNTFSETTKTTYRTHRNSYLRFCSTWDTSPFQLNQHIFASILRSYLEPSKPHPFLIILTSSAFCTKNLTCPIP